jgi:hypothetical protein
MRGQTCELELVLFLRIAGAKENRKASLTFYAQGVARSDRVRFPALPAGVSNYL